MAEYTIQQGMPHEGLFLYSNLRYQAMYYPPPIQETLDDIISRPQKSRSSGSLGSASTRDEETRHDMEQVSSNALSLSTRQLIEELE